MIFKHWMTGFVTIMGILFMGMESKADPGNILQVDHVQWRTDRDFGRYTNWKEAAVNAQSGAKLSEQGSANAFLHNISDHPVRVKYIEINGQSASELRKENKVIWYQCLPNPISAGNYGKLTVRFRTVPDKPVQIAAILEGGQRISMAINPVPMDFRINGIGFPTGGKRCAIYVKRYTQKQGDELARVSINGRIIDASETDWISRKFVNDISGCVLQPKNGFTIDDYIYIKAETRDGRVAAEVTRVLDGFVPYGTYGGIKFSDHASVGMNCYISFTPLNRAAVDEAIASGMRVISPRPADSDLMRHDGVLAYTLGDEPDIWDYKVTNVPEGYKIGQHGQALVEEIERLNKIDPATPATVNLDLTYKPFNWYTYGELTDYAAMDCYPLVAGEPLNWIVQCFGSLVDAANPKPAFYVFSNTWEEKEGRGINRRPTWHEVRRSILYGLGEGARGFLSFMDLYENSDIIFHASSEYPDSYAAQNELYRAMRPFSNLIAVNQSLEVGSCSTPKVWVRTLLCGKDAIMCVVVNEDGESTHTRGTLNPKKDVQITIPTFPWLQVKRAVCLKDGEVEDVVWKVNKQTTEIQLKQLDAGEVILLTSDAKLPETLLKEEREEQTHLAYARLQQQWKADHQKAKELAFAYDLKLNHASHAIDGKNIAGQINGYGVSNGIFWNPMDVKYNAITWYQPQKDQTNRKTKEAGKPLSEFEWNISISDTKASSDKEFYYQCTYFGSPVQIRLCDSQSGILAKQTPTQGLNCWSLPKLKEGTYKICLSQDAGPAESGTCVAVTAYVLSKE